MANFLENEDKRPRKTLGFLSFRGIHFSQSKIHVYKPNL